MATYTEKLEHTIEIVPPFQTIRCKQDILVLRDGEEIGRSTKWIIREPDGGSYPDDPEELKTATAAFHTQAVIDAWSAAQGPSPDGQIPNP